MLGLRLGAGLEDRLSRFATATRRTRSDIGRQAIEEFLDRRSGDDALMREVLAIRALSNADLDALVDANAAEMEAMLPPYDWGPNDDAAR